MGSYPRGRKESVDTFTDVTHVTVLVEDADEAKAWYTGTFCSEERSGEEFVPGVCWLTVAPSGSEVEVVLQGPNESFHGAERAAERRERIGEGATTSWRRTTAGRRSPNWRSGASR